VIGDQCSAIPVFWRIESPTDCTKVKNFSHKNWAQLNFGRRKPDFDSDLVRAKWRTFAASIGPEYQGIKYQMRTARAFWEISLTAGAGFDRKPSDKLPPSFNIVKSRWGAPVRIAQTVKSCPTNAQGFSQFGSAHKSIVSSILGNAYKKRDRWTLA
jgi:hypothetical protein